MKRVMMRTTVLMVGMAMMAACATTPKMSSSEAIAARQKLMKEQGAAMKSIQDKAKAGQAQQVGPDAQKLVETSKQIPALFPQGSVDPNTSRAKPEIWQKRPEFEGYAKSLETKAAQLAAMAPSGDPQATNAAIADLGKTTCGACHNTFRGPELKK
jgi:cytochrome c556